MGTPDSASQKATEAAQKARETGGKAGETAQKVGETIGAAVRGGKKSAQEKTDGIAADAQKAWKAQQGDSAWQKVHWLCLLLARRSRLIAATAWIRRPVPRLHSQVPQALV